MKTRSFGVRLLAPTFALAALAGAMTLPASAAPTRPEGPCDIYAKAGDPCVGAHSTTRAMYASYNGPLYQVLRQSDGKTLDIGVVQPSAGDAGGYADAAAQDAFCANTYCWISVLYDQSPKHNNLIQAPRGGFSGPIMGGFNNLPRADLAPVTVMGHKVYGVYIMPGTGLRLNDARGTAVDDQAQGQYWVIDGEHYNSGCCFDYGNAEIDSRDDGNGTMETTFYGNTPWWYHGNPPGPWIMTDQENNLVGCANKDRTNLCQTLPSISWRFVTAMAKGEPHHWTTLGGDARKGPLSLMFDGPRVDATYDPMRKQGAILLGNGGDNSNGSQGTFYEGAMTAANTFPSDSTDQMVQANVVAARYDVAQVRIAAAGSEAAPAGLQTFSPGRPQEMVVTFTNTDDRPAQGVTLGLITPRGWTSSVSGSKSGTKAFKAPVAAGASVSATFTVTPATAAYNGDIVARASWGQPLSSGRKSVSAVQKIRNAPPIRINEFRAGDGSPDNATNAFIELYNSGSRAVDLSGWTLTHHPGREAVFSKIAFPAKTIVPPRGFYVLGLANSGLVVAAQAGDRTVYVRNVDGLKAGDRVTVGSGRDAETRTLVSVGSAAARATTVWQPVPEGPVITIPAGATNVPVTSTDGIKPGDKVALGYGATYPVINRGLERYEVATVSAVGKPGTQAYLATEAPVGATNLKVSSVVDLTPGDHIRLDIDSVGHGIETVTITSVGTAAQMTGLRGDVTAGATSITVRSTVGWPVPRPLQFQPGQTLHIGMPGGLETVTITSAEPDGDKSTKLGFTPALTRAHVRGEDVVEPGSGIEIDAPLKFNHAANLPFSARGTGITLASAMKYPHSSNEPVRGIGTGLQLDKPLAKAHEIDAVVRTDGNGSAGYQGKPDQWFGGPALLPGIGSLTLKDAGGNVVDSLNWGNLVDLAAAEGFQGTSGLDKAGCYVPVPGVKFSWEPVRAATSEGSVGRYPDGHDTDSNCADWHTATSANLAAAAPAGSDTVKVTSVTDFGVGQTLVVGTGKEAETVTIKAVGTGGATKSTATAAAGDRRLIVGNPQSFKAGQVIVIGSGGAAEQAIIDTTRGNSGGGQIDLTTPLRFAHGAGEDVTGTGLTLVAPLTKAHGAGVQISTDLATPGTSNHYSVSRTTP